MRLAFNFEAILGKEKQLKTLNRPKLLVLLSRSR